MNFSIKVTIIERLHAIQAAAHKAAADKLAHAAAGIRKDARALITRSKFASSVGTPPHTRRGQLRNAIIYQVDKPNLTAIIGPRVEVAGTAGAAHEFGGSYKGQQYPQRPFMAPAMTGRLAQFAGSFAGSIGE